ncbi:PEBP-like protein [Aspergillus costaricaensis CBS 115574]|uniref:PEBP-like protein n=1 Tax=Aspergillus costaricaensis CBS 115574 TaxID=1448317 RepID=A0ACD1IJP4_9EURO|nr:PEBP-like protein [Aspergillus costaricaensis CBS 115574]RAK90697.1 PEBP-like protein [Aspergillus costaricaensis CBS 115574]
MDKLHPRIEAFLGRLLRNKRGRDAKLLTRTSPVLQALQPTIAVTSSVGPSQSPLPAEYTQVGANRFPPLSWTVPNDSVPTEKINSYVLIVEDADAPLPNPIVHGLYYGLSKDKTSISSDDVAVADASKRALQGGFQYGVNWHQNVWSGPRPVLGHGSHRYFFQVLALGKALEEKPWGKEELLQWLETEKESVLAWGEWVGTFVREP